jgi:hypothetical protein
MISSQMGAQEPSIGSKQVAINRRSSDRALKNVTIAQERILASADVASPPV